MHKKRNGGDRTNERQTLTTTHAPTPPSSPLPDTNGRAAQVLIFSPARAACQQGKALIGGWKIHPGEQQKWENPLMGWTSTGDPMAHQLNSILNFDTKEAAVAFCEKHGWEYEIAEPQKQARAGKVVVA